MARPLEELQALMKALTGVQDAYIQAPTSGMQYPCILIEHSDSDVTHADNIVYWSKKAYTITVVDRAPDSPIPDLVEALPYTRRDRFYAVNGLNHFVFRTFF